MLVNHPSQSTIDARIRRLDSVDTDLATTLAEVTDVADGNQVESTVEELQTIGHTKQAIGTAAEWLLYNSPDNADRAIAFANATGLKTVQRRVQKLLSEHGNRFQDLLRDLPWDRK